MRLFVALDLPAEVRAELAGWAVVAAPAGVRRVPADNVHLTLAFLGERDDPGALAELVAPLARPVRALRSTGPVWLPRRRPGVLAVAIADDDGALAHLRDEIVDVLERETGWSAERPSFLPHVTVGRVPRGADVRTGDPLAPTPSVCFAGTALTLYRSYLGAGGARYEALTREALDAG